MTEQFDTRIPAGELDPERPRPVETPWGSFSLFVVAGEIVCVQSFCPHMAAPLFAGTLHDGRVTCPWHYWCFDLRTGERVDQVEGGGRGALERCGVRSGPEGTIVLSRPTDRES